MKLKQTRFFLYMVLLLSNNQYMHHPFIVHTRTCQMYVTITCARLKHAPCFITWSYWYVYRTLALWNWVGISKNELAHTWAKRVFSKLYTFSCYRASQSRGTTRRPSFTACVKPSIKYIVIFIYFNSVCYLISYTRLFTKLNLFLILLYIAFLTTKFFRSRVVKYNVYM